MNFFINDKEEYESTLTGHDDMPDWKPKRGIQLLRTHCLEGIFMNMEKKLIKSQLELGKYKNKNIQLMYNEMKTELNENMEKLKEWIFITIRPDPKKNVTIEDFKRKIISITKWITFKKGYYIFEQSGENEHTMGDGIHCHLILIKYTIERKRLINRLEQTFKNICSPPFEHTINVRRKKPTHGQETLDNYMMGLKQEDKLLKVEMDIKWRQIRGIDDIYFFDTTTDKVSKKVTDGRVSNGGHRAGAGRKPAPKEENTICNDIKWGESVTLDF